MYQDGGACSQSIQYTQLGETPCWNGVLEPLGPLATYSQQNLSQTVTSAQVEAQQTPHRPPPTRGGNTGLPSVNRQPDQTRYRDNSKTDQPRFAERQMRPDRDSEWYQTLARAHIDETRMGWLWDEGFTNAQSLRLLNAEAMECFIEAKRGEGPIPFAQLLALRRLAGQSPTTNRVFSQQDKAVGQPRPTTNPPPLEKQMPGLFQSLLTPTDNQPQRGLDYQDPTVMLRMPGKQVTYHDITEFIPGCIMAKERVPIAGSDSQIVLETGPKRPALHKITLSQWNCANVRILDMLLLEGALDTQTIPDYLAYTQRINRMYERYEWETILLYDREYRQVQATVNMRWEMDVRHLSDVHLREKPLHDSHAQGRRDRRSEWPFSY